MATTMNYARIILVKFLQRLEEKGEIVPGAVEQLQRHIPPMADAGATFERAVGLLTGDGSCFLTKQGKRCLRQEEPLRFLLDRLPLKQGSSDELYREWAAGFAEYPLARQAKLALDKLTLRGHERHLFDNRAEEIEEDRVYRTLAAIERFDEFLSPDLNRMELAREWAGDCGQLKHHEACKRVASRLKEPYFASKVCRDGNPAVIYGSDDRFYPLDSQSDRCLGEETKIRLRELGEATALVKKDLDRVRANNELMKLGLELARVESHNAAMAEVIKVYERERSSTG